MSKFDAPCGLTKKQIAIIKYKIKDKILRKLPFLPDYVETKLFFEGRDAWTFTWCLLNEQYPIASTDGVSLEIVAKLKKEFHLHLELVRHTFLCEVHLSNDEYQPMISIIKKKA